jgi:hypothetical protein
MHPFLHFLDWRERNRAFASIAAYDVRGTFTLTTSLHGAALRELHDLRPGGDHANISRSSSTRSTASHRPSTRGFAVDEHNGVVWYVGVSWTDAGRDVLRHGSMGPLTSDAAAARPARAEANRCAACETCPSLDSAPDHPTADRPCDRRARGPVRRGGDGRDEAVARPYDQKRSQG